MTRKEASGPAIIFGSQPLSTLWGVEIGINTVNVNRILYTEAGPYFVIAFLINNTSDRSINNTIREESN